LADEVAASLKTEFLSQDAQRAVGGDEVYGQNSLVALDRKQELFKEKRSAGPGGGNSEVVGFVVGQRGS
jgi:hypothetical protein